MQAKIDFFDKYANFYDICSGDNGKKTNDLAFYKSLSFGREKLLEIGCGTGRVLLGLKNEFLTLDGVDISEKMLLRAAEKTNEHASISLHRMDATETLPVGTFDIIIISWFTLNYIQSQEKQIKILRNSFDQLASGGMVVLDLFYPKSMRPGCSSETWVEEMKSFQHLKTFFHRSDERTMIGDFEHRKQTFHIDGKEYLLDSIRKYISPRSMNDMLVECGFVNVKFGKKYKDQEKYNNHLADNNFQMLATKL